MMTAAQEKALADKAMPGVAAHLAGEPVSPELAEWIEHINELERTAPHGRCDDCGGALTAHDAQYKLGMHVACANGKYGD